MLVIYSAGESETVEKHSKFFGYTAPVKSEAEARAAIAMMKKKYPQAGHHVFAYDVQEENGRFTRQSDDGEPHGTAGFPILQLFTKQEIINFVCVVARIFGGVLLGKGGLARAYTAAAKESLTAAGFGPLIVYRKYAVTVPYSEWDKFKYDLKKNEIPVDGVVYTNECVVMVTVTDGQENIFRKLVGAMKVDFL